MEIWLYRQAEHLKRLVAFLCVLSKQNSEHKKQDCIQTYFLLKLDNSVRQLALSPAYIYFIMIHNMVIIMNNINYIYKYEKLKYGVFIFSLLTATSYKYFYTIYKNAVHAKKIICFPTYMPLATSNFSTEVQPICIPQH